MAEGNGEGLTSIEEPIPGGHKIIYNLRLQKPYPRGSKSYDREYDVQCFKSPTLWKLELIYEEDPEEVGSYDLSIELTKVDRLNKHVMLSLNVSFLNEHDRHVRQPLNFSQYGLLYEEPYDHTFKIDSIDYRNIDRVRVTIVVENCHEGIDSGYIHENDDS